MKLPTRSLLFVCSPGKTDHKRLHAATIAGSNDPVSTLWMPVLLNGSSTKEAHQVVPIPQSIHPHSPAQTVYRTTFQLLPLVRGNPQRLRMTSSYPAVPAPQSTVSSDEEKKTLAPV